MSDKTLGDGTGCIITLEELQSKLIEISHEDHQWTAVAEYCGGTRNRKMVHAIRVWYTNPGVPEMPNMICYEFPAFPDAIWGDPEGALICLHPSLITPVMEGLY